MYPSFSFISIGCGQTQSVRRGEPALHWEWGSEAALFAASDLKTHLSLALPTVFLSKAAFVRVINRPLPALYPSTNNYANKNQWTRQH